MLETDQMLSNGDVSETQNMNRSAIGQDNRKVYASRWVVLALITLTTALKSFNQSSFGSINNVYSLYFNVDAWQIDWFGVIQSTVYVVLTLPLAVLVKRMSLRLVLCVITGTITLGYTLTTVSLITRKGYVVMLLAQATMGFGSVLVSAVPPAIAAVWFPTHEVATAVAIQVLAQGLGSGVGCTTPPFLVTTEMSTYQVRKLLMTMYGSLTLVNTCIFIYSLLFLKNQPPSPPSEAQAKAIIFLKNEVAVDLTTISKRFCSTVKLLCTSGSFVVVCLVFGASPPVIKTSTILLSSMLHERFKSKSQLNKQAGIALAIAWSAYAVGSIISGPIVTRLRRYKEVVTSCVIVLFVTCLMTTVGIAVKSMLLIYAAMVLQGFALGLAGTATYELLVEITYPESGMLVSMLGMEVLGIFRLIYPIVGRVLLESSGATASTSMPLVTMFLLSISLMCIKPEYKRQQANSENESLIR